MAEAALCTVWGGPIRGREKHALNVYNDAMRFWVDLQARGEIERFDVTILGLSSGDVTGFLVARGTAEQIDSVRRSKEYLRHVARGQLVSTRVTVATAHVDEELAEFMSRYQKVIELMA